MHHLGMLWITPFLFPTVAIHALIAADVFNAMAVILLYGTSLCLHSNPALFGPYHPVTVLDKALCCVIALYVGVATSDLQLDWRTAFVWFSMAYMPAVYFLKVTRHPAYNPRRWYPWHTSIHLVTVAGMHCFFHAKRYHQQERPTLDVWTVAHVVGDIRAGHF